MAVFLLTAIRETYKLCLNHGSIHSKELQMKQILKLCLCMLLITGLLVTFTGVEARRIPPTVTSPGQSGTYLSNMAYQVIAIANRDRAAAGLAPLVADPELTAAAMIRAEEITRKLSHTRPDGSRWSTVSPLAYGENIARGQRTAEKVAAAWMSSPGHRKNIMNARYGSIGVACYKVNGIYHWVQLFGK